MEHTQRLTPPQDTEAEMSLIGFCIESIEAFDAARRVLQGNGMAAFASTFAGNVWVAMCEIVQRNDAIDIASIRIQLQKRKQWPLDGHEQITSCIEAASANRGTNAESIACHVSELAMKRELIRACSKTIEAAYSQDGDATAILQQHQGSIARIEGVTMKETGMWLRDAVPLTLAKVQEQQRVMAETGRAIVGQPSGIELLDHKTGGSKDGELITWAARPGGGKSVIAANGAIAGAMLGMPQAIISLEMDTDMQVRRIFADIAEIPNHVLQQARLGSREWEQVNRVSGKVQDLPIYFDYVPGLDVVRLEATIRKLVRQGVRRAYVDYLQLMDDPADSNKSSKSFNDNERIGRITKRLKQLAGELSIPIEILSQMSREIDKRPGEKIPTLSDLRGSGNIEQDSNSVFFLYSPIEYEQSIKGYCQKFYSGMTPPEMQRLSMIIVAKQRNGQKLPIPFWFDRKYCRMSDIKESTTFRSLGLQELLDDVPEYAQRMGIQMDLFKSTNTPINEDGDDEFPF